MNRSLMYLLITIFGGIGAYIPSLLGANGFSMWAIIGSAIGGLFGIWVGVKISNNM